MKGQYGKTDYRFLSKKTQLKSVLLFCGLLVVLFFHSDVTPNFQKLTGLKRGILLDEPLPPNHDDDYDINGTLVCSNKLISKAADPCAFVIERCDEELNESRVPYLKLPYCALPGQKWLAYAILIFLVLLSFFILGTVSDRFFLPALSSVSSALNLPPTVAGVTLLGWGNGAPDISATYANIVSGKYSQSFGQLIGAGMFVGICISGIVVLIQATTVKRRPFLRDVGFFITTICSVFFVCYDHTITIAEAVIWLGLYALYVTFVIVGRYVYTRRKASRQKLILSREKTRLLELGQHLPSDHPIFDLDRSETDAVDDEFIIEVVRAIENNELPAIEGSEEEKAQKRKVLETILEEMDVTFLSKVGFYNPETKRKEKTTVENNSLQVESAPSHDNDLIGLESATELPSISRALDSDVFDLDTIYDQSVGPPRTRWTKFIQYMEWDADKWYEVVFYVITSPIMLFLHVMIPWTEEEKYSRILYVLHPLGIAIYFMFIFNDYWDTELEIHGTQLGLLSYWIFPLAILLSVAVYFTSKNEVPPKYAPIYIFVSLVMSALVISSVANELVTILGALGVGWSISPAVMGLTVLSWGNSVGDLMSNIIIARKGFPQMAIGACFSAPLTNLLIGLGLSFLVGTIKSGSGKIVLDSHKVPVPDITNTHYIGLFFLLAILVVTLIAVPIFGFRIPRYYGGFLILNYVAFMVVSLLLAFNIILPDIVLWDY